VENARLADIARENHLPSILLVESAGADLPQQSKIFVPEDAASARSRDDPKNAYPLFPLCSAARQQRAYLPGMSDY